MGRARSVRSARETEARDHGRLPRLRLGQSSARARRARRRDELPNRGTLSLVHQLLLAHEHGLALSRTLLVAQGIADETESEAARAFELAAARPWDEELAECAVAAAV